jgi:asparagine synthase (glutamine-hydrolysing)
LCGIAGILSSRQRVNPQAVQAMTGLMAHRGPDGAGLWENPTGLLVLGHRRLAIIDPSPASAQPFVTGDIALTFNGEIYNYREIRAELITRGHVFSTEGDSEVIVAAWRQWGEACVEFFNGMFAFALWDEAKGQLFCARDRFGEKPFLYVEGDGFFAFASEYKALLTLDGVSAAVEDDRLARFLVVPADGLDRDERTLFPAIRQLPPAQVMTIDGHTLERHNACYWTGQPARKGRRPTLRDAAFTFRDLLADSVRLRLRSDVPVGSCLSGGLDSSAIVCLARRELGDTAHYHTFSGRFPGTSADEGPYMDSVAAATHPVRHEVEPKPENLLAELAHFSWANELPVDSASQYAQYCVFRLARQNGVKVLLDGQGADEILGGYEQYFTAYLRGGGTDSPLIHSRYGDALTQVQPWHARLPPGLRRLLARTLHKGSDISFGLNGDVRIERRPPPATLHEALRRDSLDGFLGTLLRYGDRNSMAHSVEVRLPFTDHRIFEFVQGLPVEYLMGDGETKRLLRTAMDGTLPDMVRLRWRKHGFVPPQVAWLHQTLLPAVEQAVEDSSLSPLWDRAWWRSAIRRFRAGDTSQAAGLWKLLACESWRTHFLDAMRGRHKFQPLL